MEVCSKSEVVDALNKLLWVLVIVQVDDTTDTNIRTILQCPWQCQCAVTTTCPVMVFHVSAIHVPNTRSCLNGVHRVYHSIIKCCHDGSSLEYRARFQQVAYSMVLNLSIFTVATFVEIDDCFHITRRYLHHNGNTYVAINLFQLVNQRTFG